MFMLTPALVEEQKQPLLYFTVLESAVRFFSLLGRLEDYKIASRWLILWQRKKMPYGFSATSEFPPEVQDVMDKRQDDVYFYHVE